MDSINLNFRRLKGKHIVNTALVISIPLTVFAFQWDGRAIPESQCYGIKELKGITYQVNACTGKHIPLNTLAANTVSTVSTSAVSKSVNTSSDKLINKPVKGQ